MIAVVPILIVAALALLVLSTLVRRTLDASKVLRDVARRLGIDGAGSRLGRISGEVEGHRVTLLFVTRGATGDWIATVIASELRTLSVHPPSRPIANAPLGAVVRGAIRAPIRTGDDAFDSAVVVHGDAIDATALRDPLTRALVRDAVDRGLEIYDGTLTLHCRPGAAAIEEDVRTLWKLARRLAARPPELAPGQLSVADAGGDGAVSLADKKQSTC